MSANGSATAPDRSVLVVHSRDLTSPFGSTIGYYVARHMAGSATVHVVCRRRPSGRDPPDGTGTPVYHTIDTGELPVVSGALFVLLSTLYAAVLGAYYRFDAVYAFKSELLQGWCGARCSGGRFVVELQAVPVRQTEQLSSGDGRGTTALMGAAIRRCYGAVAARALRGADAVVCLTEGIRDVTERQFRLALPEPHVVGMGVDTETFVPRESDGGQRTGPWTLTYLGTIHETRNLDTVIEGVARTDHDVRLLIAGDGPAEHVGELRRQSRDLGVADRVEFLGLVAHDDVPELLRETDVALSPLSPIESYRISFPGKLLEYMASGCLVVATDLLPHRRLLTDGETGYLYDGGAEEFRATLERCLADRDHHDAVRTGARQTALDYDWETVATARQRVIFGE